jgi:hypothetical protein
MRICDESYSVDIRRFNLAGQMLGDQARTHIIKAWTGLSADRIEKLTSVHRREGVRAIPSRNRGPARSQLLSILSRPSQRNEAAAVAGILRMLNVLPERPVSHPEVSLPSLSLGERLMSARELFAELVPNAQLTLEDWILLLFSLAEGSEWSAGHCKHCPALILVDHLGLGEAVCDVCRRAARRRNKLLRTSRCTDRDRAAAGPSILAGEQLDFFSLEDLDDSPENSD